MDKKIKFDLMFDENFYYDFHGAGTFLDNLKMFTQGYEKRYKTSVYGFAIIGEAGTWQGRFPAGKVVSSKSFFSAFGRDINNFEVVIDSKNKETIIYAHHHDSYHVFKVYLISDSKAEKFSLYNLDLIPQERLDTLSKNLTKVNLSKYYE